MSEFSAFELEGLRAHNEHRRKHGVPPMKLSRKLCNSAQSWINNVASWGALRHSTFEQRGGTGENLYGGNRCFNDSAVNLAKAATDMWYDEVRYWNYSSGGFSMQTGHFTQVVWKNSTELGIATARGQMGDFVCAHYNPPGNFQGQFQANVPRLVPKSEWGPPPETKKAEPLKKPPAEKPKPKVEEAKPTKKENSENTPASGSSEDDTTIVAYCDGCEAIIRTEVHNKCMTCPDFHLCRLCTGTFEHEHKDFWNISWTPRVSSPKVKWVGATGGAVPDGSLVAGGGGPVGCDIYVARAHLQGQLLIGKLLPICGGAFIPWQGQEHGVGSYETPQLNSNDVSWIAGVDAKMAERAVVGGVTERGDLLYIGRGHHQGETVVGTVYPDKTCLCFSYGGKELSTEDFELLVLNAV